MLTGKHVNKEAKIIDENAEITKGDRENPIVFILKHILKATGLIVKLLRDIRFNQARIMESQGISLVKEDKNNKKEGKSNVK